MDGIRGIAILLVVIYHYITCAERYDVGGEAISYVGFATRYFWTGVDLFFVLSGFLIGGIILDNYQKGKFLSTFFIRRSCRILHVMFLLVATCYFLQAVVDAEQYKWLFGNLLPWWSYLTFTQNILMGSHAGFGSHFLAVTWSLAVEEQFFLCVPFLILLLGRRVFVQALLPLAVSAFVLRLAFPGFHTHVNMVFRMDSLLAGVFLAALIRNKMLWSFLTQYRFPILLSFVGLSLATAALTVPDEGFGYLKLTWFAAYYSLLLLVALLYQGSLLTSFLRFPALCFFGGLAYGIYMYHEGIAGLLHGWLNDGRPPSIANPRALGITLVSFASTIFLAWCSFHLYEKPFLRIGRSRSYGEEPRELAAKNA